MFTALSVVAASNDTLRELDLSWNHIRLKGACAIAQGIKVPRYIDHLTSYGVFTLSGTETGTGNKLGL